MQKIKLLNHAEIGKKTLTQIFWGKRNLEEFVSQHLFSDTVFSDHMFESFIILKGTTLVSLI